MKLNYLQKNFYIFFSVTISILIVTLLWDKITLPFINFSDAKGFLAQNQYNPNNDILRYIFFITLPLLTFLATKIVFEKETINIRELLLEKREKSQGYDATIAIISLVFIFLILLEFFSVRFSFTKYNLDHFHDGNYLTPFQNYLSTKKLWTSSHLTHGASDIFFPFITSKIFDTQSIGGTRSFAIFLVLIVKLLSILLSYQFTKISKLNKETKILFFTIFTLILISMSRYTFLGKSYYISHKDIYIILFLIFFIELFFNSKLKFISIISISFIATIAILFQIDKGAYINFILIFYFLYLLCSKKYKDFFLLLISFSVSWLLVINFVGFEEFKSFLNNTKSMASTMDLMTGLKYPEPFFSIGSNSDGARATKGLLIQLLAGLFILNYLTSNKSKILSSKKTLFIFLFFLSLVMYKNALGRSDGTHIRDSHDMPIIICCFFALNYLLLLMQEKNLTKKKISSLLSVIFIFFYLIYNQHNYNFENIKTYKQNFSNFINLNDEVFLDEGTIELIAYYNQISTEEVCVENITFFDAMPYLLKKPSCTKYWASWLASPSYLQKDYISKLKKIEPKYILYSNANLKLDGVGIYERIALVDDYVSLYYKKHIIIDRYIILEKK